MIGSCIAKAILFLVGHRRPYMFDMHGKWNRCSSFHLAVILCPSPGDPPSNGKPRPLIVLLCAWEMLAVSYRASAIDCAILSYYSATGRHSVGTVLEEEIARLLRQSVRPSWSAMQGVANMDRWMVSDDYVLHRSAKN